MAAGASSAEQRGLVVGDVEDPSRACESLALGVEGLLEGRDVPGPNLENCPYVRGATTLNPNPQNPYNPSQQTPDPKPREEKTPQRNNLPKP